MKVSVMLLCIDRYDELNSIASKFLANAGYDYELLIADNGSKDTRVFEWCEKQQPKIYIKHGMNKGTTQSLNQLMALNPSDAYVFVGNDISMPTNWLKKMVDVYEATGNAGMIGIDWRQQAKNEPKQVINGVEVIPTEKVFGSTFISQKALDVIGSLCEDYGVYGLWDSDCAFRCSIGGLTNYYVGGMESEHCGNDYGEQTPYRIMKDKSLSAGQSIFKENLKRYQETKQIYIKNKNL